jgi:hypothetical protein
LGLLLLASPVLAGSTDTVNTFAIPSGDGTVAPATATVSKGDPVQVTATANPNFTFSYWSVTPVGHGSFDIAGSGQVDPKSLATDLAILNTRLNALPISAQTDADGDLSGDGAVTTADRVLLNRVLNGLLVP